MALTYEISKFESNMPLRCYIHHIGNIQKHSHEMFEIIFILSGECTLTMDDHLYQLKEDDILIIENFASHELHSQNCVYASLQLDQTRLENTFPSPMHPSFECNSQIPGKEEAFDSIRRLIAHIIKNNADKPRGYELKNWIYIYELMEILFMNFRVERSAALEKKSHRYAERVYEISKIIKAHYTEDLTLSALADIMHLSVPYLSKFFMEHFGVNFLTYVTNLRIKNAEYELLHSEKTIETISADCGFPNANAFTAAFKKEYGVLPSAYRRNSKLQPIATTPIEYHDYLSSLKKYLTVQETGKTISTTLTEKKHADIDCLASTRTLSHTWKNIISIGQASDLLLADIQKLLCKVQNDLAPRYIFFNGILSDNLYFYQLDNNENAIYNYTFIDHIFDFLISLNLKPMFSFSYMPRKLAKNPELFLFNHLVSEPQNLDAWCNLIENFMNHIVNRYGLEEIKSWRFSVWHQPNTPSRLFGFNNNEDYFVFFKKTREIVKNFSEDLTFGLPCMYYLDNPNNNFIPNMMTWCKENDCLPDYFNYTFYDTILDNSRNNTQDSFGFVDSMTLNPNSDGLKKAITRMKKISHECDLDKLPIYICEWNNTPSQQDYLNDTCYKSCYITKNILENYDRIDGLSYWSLTDLMTEHPQTGELFFGGLGLFTTSGIPKASYYALKLLGKLGNEFLGSGENWFATKRGNDICIIAYHYKHYTNLYASGERFDMTKTDRYTMFEPSTNLDLTINLNNLPKASYTVTEYILNRDHGSAFDTWVTSGCIDPFTTEETTYLESSLPQLHKSTAATHDGTLTLTVSMQLLETRLITLSFWDRSFL